MSAPITSTASAAAEHSLQPPGGAKKQQKQQQQKGHQQGPEFSQQKGRVESKQANQASRPATVGSAGQNNRQADHPRNDSKQQQVNQAGGAKTQQQPTRSAPKTPTRLSLFDHLPRKLALANPYSIEGDISLHSATIKLGKLKSAHRPIVINRNTTLTAIICRFTLQDWIRAV
jgi:hypothetical protein